MHSHESMLYSTSFNLKIYECASIKDNSRYPSISTNLHRRCGEIDEAAASKRYRSRNSFIMARQHFHNILPRDILLTKKSKIVSKLWASRSHLIDSYYRYLAALDTTYLTVQSHSNTRRSLGRSYTQLCSSTYQTSRRTPQEYKINKFQVNIKTKPFKHNNIVLGLKVNDVVFMHAKEIR